MRLQRPLATLSVDLDNLWSHLKTHGESDWKSFPSYLETAVPRALALLQDLNLSATFFVVGHDAKGVENHAVLRSIVDAGHEIGNHSYLHEPWLHLYPEREIENEISLAEANIENATGRRPIGYRGPGHSLCLPALRILARRGYLYDASTWPTVIIPVARTYYFMTAQFSSEEKKLRRSLGGTLRDSLRPLKPYRWRVDSTTILEIPVTTMPVLKLPIHMSYLHLLQSVFPPFVLQYFGLALSLCQRTGTPPSLLLHATDFLGRDDTSALWFLPGMRQMRDKKIKLLTTVLRQFTGKFHVVTMEQLARELTQAGNLPVMTPRFRGERS
jgi:hypothetical protein